MHKVWLVVAVCYCLQGCECWPMPCGETYQDEPFKAIFQTEKISKEVGELFSVDISLEDEDGKPVKLTEDMSLSGKYRRYLYVTDNDDNREGQLEQLSEVENLTVSNLRVGWRDGGIFLPTSPPPPRNEGKVIDNGTTARFENCYSLEKRSGVLTVMRSGSFSIDDEIPFEIVANTGVTADFVLHPADNKVVVKIADGDANHNYQVFKVYDYPPADQRIEQAGEVTLDAEGKGEVRFPIDIPKRSCSLSFTVLLKASDSDNSRIVSKEVEIMPCFVSEDGGTIRVTDDGSLTFTDKSYTSCSEAKKITWSYANKSDYTKLSEGGTLRVNPSAPTVDLGVIPNYEANSCYLIVVKSACLGKEDSHPTRSRVGSGC